MTIAIINRPKGLKILKTELSVTDRRTDDGPMADGQKLMANPLCRWPILFGDGQWPKANGRWPMDNGQWPMADDRWTNVNGQNLMADSRHWYMIAKRMKDMMMMMMRMIARMIRVGWNDNSDHK